MTRRLAIQLMMASADFWNRRPAAQWDVDEVQRLLHDSPWAKTVNADFDTDAEGAPSITRGGVIGPPAGPTHRRSPVQVIWESGQPVLDARRGTMPSKLAGRYVLSAGEIPLSAMEHGRRGADPADTQTDRLRRMMEQLAAATTLEAKGKSPIQPGVVEPSPRIRATWLFGFSRELLDIDRDDREVVFTVQTALVTLRAKFEPKQMVYRGMLSL